MQPRGPKFRSSAPMQKPGAVAHTCSCRMVGIGRSLQFKGQYENGPHRAGEKDCICLGLS